MSRPRPATEALESLPAQTVRRLGGLDIERLREQARKAGHRFVLVQCAGCADKKAVLQAIGSGFGFPDWYGANLDALYDCVTDLAERGDAGWLVVLKDLPVTAPFDAEQRAAMVAVFRDAADDFAVRGTPFRVFYS